MITQSQMKRLHQLLNQLRQMPFKAELVLSFSQGRTESSKELTLAEARELIKHLEGQVPKTVRTVDESDDRMRKKVFAICRSMGYIYGNTAADYKINQAVVYGIIERKGYLHKPLMQYSPAELPRLVSQFEMMERKKDLKAARVEVERLLSEMGLKNEGGKA